MNKEKVVLEVCDLKDMLEKTGKLYGEKDAYIIKDENNGYITYTHKEVREMINSLGTALLDLGLKNKRIAVIGENRFEWQIAYLAEVCGVGTIVPLDKSLPENELKRLIERSGVEAIFYTEKNEEKIKNILVSGTGCLKHIISMDLKEHIKGIYSERELIERGRKLIASGNTEYENIKIDSEEMKIMLFTSGTTSESKVVALSHRNIVSNLMGIRKVVNVNSDDRFLSFLPLHHVFECTVGFLLGMYSGARIAFCTSIRRIEECLNEYQITIASFVPAIYENFYKTIIRRLEKQGKLEEYLSLLPKYENKSWEEKREKFKIVYDTFGGYSKLFVTGAAAISSEVLKNLRGFGINLCQAYGLTETSPIVGIETEKNHKLGSIGKTIPEVEAKIVDASEDGVGELYVKGPNVMMGYFENEEATKDVLDKDGWFKTGDLAYIDDEGYIFIKGRKKSVIVLKNVKNIFPEEMENLINRIEGVKESFVFGKSNSDDKDDIKIFAKLVIDKAMVKNMYKVESEEDIIEELYKKIKEINKIMPAYKAIRGIYITEEPLIKTTTSKIKRQEEIKTIV